MQQEHTKFGLKIYLQLAVLGGCWAIVYLIPYLQYTWYDPLQEFLGATNTQLGLLITIYGFGNVFGAPVGGWLADRFNYKTIYVSSVVLNAVFGALFLIHPTYKFAIVMWIGFAISSLFLNYPTHIKIVRALVSEADQGRVFGFNETSIGLFNIICSSTMMAAFSMFVKKGQGIQAAVVANIILSIILAILAAFILQGPTKEELAERKAAIAAKKAEKNSDEEIADSNFLKNLVHMAKMPGTWLVGITIFAIYSFMSTLTYFTPYFGDVLGVAVTFTGWTAILRQYGTQIIGAPVGGILADKIGSPSKVCMITYIFGGAGLIYMLLPKESVTVGFVIGLTLFMSFVVYIGRGAYYATISETGIPRELTASAIGIAAAVGFSPDLFQFVLFGHWLDTKGNTAYTYMFTYQFIVLVIGFIAALMILRLKKKAQLKEQAEA